MKSKGMAYVLLVLAGVFGAHRFYIGKIGTGVLYLLTLGLGGIGVIYDLITLGSQVDTINAKFGASNTNTQNVVVNVTAPAATNTENN